MISDVSVSYAMDPWYKLGRKRKLQALKQINCAIQSGSITGIVGESGSGKSTLLNIIGLLDEHDEGNYYLNGQLIEHLDEKKAAILRNKFFINNFFKKRF